MYIFRIFSLIIVQWLIRVAGEGLLIMYRPLDITNTCMFSRDLRYDLSFGMGMSDTTTLLLRVMDDISYQCLVEIVTDRRRDMIMVIKFPDTIERVCLANYNTIVVIRRNGCINLCAYILSNNKTKNIHSSYFTTVVRNKFRFRYTSNSSINANSSIYQVTATTARKKPLSGCTRGNETFCSVNEKDYCFTNGIVCDGIKNCGVSDWFDERQSMCGLPVERLEFAPVLAISALIFCILLAASHILLHCLPPTNNSFFVFNVNEDNRLRTDPLLLPPEDDKRYPFDVPKKRSLIPVSSSSSSENVTEQESVYRNNPERSAEETFDHYSGEQTQPLGLSTTLKTMSAKLQQKLREMAGRGNSDPVVA